MITKKDTKIAIVASIMIFVFISIGACEELGVSFTEFFTKWGNENPQGVFTLVMHSLVLGAGVTLVFKICAFLLAPRPVQHTVIDVTAEKERMAREAADPFLHGFERIDRNNKHYRLPIGKYLGEIAALPQSLLGNILILGSDGMRKLSGVIIPMIQWFVRRCEDIIIIDDFKGTIFRALYPLIKAEDKIPYIYDIQNLENSPGFNALKSVRTPFGMNWLANVMAEGAGYAWRMKESISTILVLAFSNAKEKSQDATLSDAEKNLSTCITKEDVKTFLETTDKGTWRNWRKEALLEYIDERWDRLYEIAQAVLAPYAAEAGLNRGPTAADILENSKKESHGKNFVLLIRPAPSSSPIAPITGFMLWNVMSERVAKGCTEEANIPGGYKTKFRHLSVFIAGIAPFKIIHSRFSLNEWVGTSANNNATFVVNEEVLGEDSPDYVRYCKYYIATGGVDDATAQSLAKKSYPKGSYLFDERISVDEIKNIDRSEMIFFGDPDDVDYPSMGAFHLQKLYYKDNAHSRDLILNMETGEVKTLSIEGYEYRLEESFEPVSKHQPKSSEGGACDDL